MGWFSVNPPARPGLAAFDGIKKVLDWDQAKQAPLVKVLDIRDGDGGTEDTVNIMARLALQGATNPSVVLLAQKIVNGVAPKDYRAELEALYAYVIRNVRYRMDPRGLEWIQTPYYTLLVRGEGDCDDESVVLGALAMSIGHGVAFKAVKGDPDRSGDYSHVYVVLGYRTPAGPVWLPADPTQLGRVPLGWEPPRDKVFASKTWVIANP